MKAPRTQTALPRDTPQTFGYVYDSDGQVIGKEGNLNEGWGDFGQMPNAILNPVQPAVVPRTKIEAGAFWYNDFGLEYSRIYYPAPYYLGWMGWYDWRWNHKRTNGYNAQGYYPDRHPSLGWYRGDDVNVLSWQAKWLVEHGVSWAVIQQRAILPTDNDNWATTTSVAHWVYQLVNNVPEVTKGNLKLAFWLPFSNSINMAYGPHSGIYSSTTTYKTNQIVVVFDTAMQNPVYYIALQDTLGNTPASSPTYWKVIPTWSSATTYSTGDRVFYVSSGGPKFWIAVAGSTNVTPSGNPASWQVTSDWNSTLTYTEGQVVIATASTVKQYVATSASGNTNKAPATNPTYWVEKEMPSEWNTFASFYNTYKDRIKTTTLNNKIYPLVFMWDAESCRTYWGTGTFSKWLQDLGTALRTLNPDWAGVAPLMNNSPSPSVYNGQTGLGGSVNYDTALTGGALLLRTNYTGTGGSYGAATGANGYQNLIDGFGPTFSSSGQAQAIDRRVHCIPTSVVSISPTTTGLNYQGNTPAKFQSFVEKAITHMNSGQGHPKLLLVYNVSEWTEGGAALQPNRKDGFGYLTALKNAVQDT